MILFLYTLHLVNYFSMPYSSLTMPSVLKTFGPLAAISLITDFDALINLCIKINYESIHKYFDKEHQIIENGWKKI